MFDLTEIAKKQQLQEQADKLAEQLLERRESRGGVHMAPESADLLMIRICGIRERLKKLTPDILNSAWHVLGLSEMPGVAETTGVRNGEMTMLMWGLHEGDQSLELELMDVTSRILALEHGLADTAVTTEAIPYPNIPSLKTELIIPQEWDTCLVHNISCHDRRLIDGIRVRARMMGFTTNSNNINLQFTKNPQKPSHIKYADRNIRTVLGPLLAMGEGSSEHPGPHPQGLCVDFFTEGNKRMILEGIDLFPASLRDADVMTLIGPMYELIENAIYRAATGLRSVNLQITLPDAEKLVRRLLTEHPDVVDELLSNIREQGYETSRPQIEEDVILKDIVPLSVLLANISLAKSENAKQALTRLLSSILAEGVDPSGIAEEALFRFSPTLREAVSRLQAQGLDLDPELDPTIFDTMAVIYGKTVSDSESLVSDIDEALQKACQIHERQTGILPAAEELMDTLGNQIVYCFGPALEFHFHTPATDLVRAYIEEALKAS